MIQLCLDVWNKCCVFKNCLYLLMYTILLIKSIELPMDVYPVCILNVTNGITAVWNCILIRKQMSAYLAVSSNLEHFLTNSTRVFPKCLYIFVTEFSIFKLKPIHASVIYQFRWICWNPVQFRENSNGDNSDFYIMSTIVTIFW